MSVFEYPDAEMQMCNNAAFENGARLEDATALMKTSSWWNQCLESTDGKENLNPVFEEASPLPFETPIKKPLQSNNNVAANSPENPVKIVSKQDSVLSNSDEGKIDVEIGEIEKEIRRLTARLDALRLRKAEVGMKRTVEKRRRVVAAKFLEPRQNLKVEKQLMSSAKRTNRRGMSLGPAEIVSGSKTGFLGKEERAGNRRKSCFWKLGEIDELKVTKERGKSSSLSPRSRKNASKIQAPKQAVTTITTSKKMVKKDNGILGLIQPKTLFQDDEKSAQSKKGVKPGRIVASRYSQAAVNKWNGSLSEARKRSFPESENKEEGNKGRSSQGNGVRVKKKWEIPSEAVVLALKADDDDEEDAGEEDSPQRVLAMREVLPRIRTGRCVNETPRDSGSAKRVADLVGRKSFFGSDVEGEETGDPVLKVLSFGDDE